MNYLRNASTHLLAFLQWQIFPIKDDKNSAFFDTFHNLKLKIWFLWSFFGVNQKCSTNGKIRLKSPVEKVFKSQLQVMDVKKNLFTWSNPQNGKANHQIFFLWILQVTYGEFLWRDFPRATNWVCLNRLPEIDTTIELSVSFDRWPQLHARLIYGFCISITDQFPFFCLHMKKKPIKW